MDTYYLSPTPSELKIIENNVEESKKHNPQIDYKNVVCVKPWGYEFLVYESDKIGIWCLKIEHGHGTSLHTHFHKDTFVIVLDGCAKVSLQDESFALNKMESVFIPKHKFHALSSYSQDVYLLEIEIFDSLASFSDKNDLLRINDTYARPSTGYETSVTRISDDLDKYGHFMLANNFQTSVQNTSIIVGSTVNSKSKYNILLDGILRSKGTYFKEGTLLATDCEYSYNNNLILSINAPFCEEDQKIIYCPEQLNTIVSRLKSQEKRIVLTSGCYDILHVGHLTNLKQAKQLGDVLIVCLSSDAQIRALKGESRPVNNYADRINLFKTISYVDYIVLYDEENIATEATLGKLMKIVDPYAWTKGSDYTKAAILAKHPYLKNIVLIDNVKDKSTTNIIKKASSSKS